MDFFRRLFLVRTGLTISGIMTGRSALAQSRADTTTAAITLNRAAAFQLLSDIHGRGADLNVASADPFIQRDLTLRKQLSEILSAVPPGSRDEYVLREHRALVTVMQREGVPLLPETEPIVVGAPPPSGGCEESLTAVVIDICMKAVGFNEDVQAVLRVAFEKSPELDAYVDQIARSVGMRDGEQVVEGILQIVRLLASESFRRRIEKIVGPDAWKLLSKQVALKFGAKFVPFVGWVYTAVSIGTAVYVNFDRLSTAVKCRATKG